MPMYRHKSGATTGVKVNTPHFKFLFSINEGGDKITFSFIWYKGSFLSKHRGLIHLYWFGKTYNKFF